MNDVAAARLDDVADPRAGGWWRWQQTASTLPVFVLGLPAGALADILDRRRYLMFTQFWVAGVAVLVCITVLSDTMSVRIAALPDLRQRHRAGDADAGLRRHRARARAAPGDAAAIGAQRRCDERSRAHRRPDVAGALIAGGGSVSRVRLNAVLSVAAGSSSCAGSTTPVARALPERALPRRDARRRAVRAPVGAHATRCCCASPSSSCGPVALLALLPLVARDLAWRRRARLHAAARLSWAVRRGSDRRWCCCACATCARPPGATRHAAAGGGEAWRSPSRPTPVWPCRR